MRALLHREVNIVVPQQFISYFKFGERSKFRTVTVHNVRQRQRSELFNQTNRLQQLSSSRTWRVSIVVGFVDAAAPAQQQLQTPKAPVKRRAVNRRPAVLVQGVHILQTSSIQVHTNFTSFRPTHAGNY